MTTDSLAFSFCVLPEISEEALMKEMESKGFSRDVGPFIRQYRAIFGFIAQMCYVYASRFLTFIWNSTVIQI